MALRVGDRPTLADVVSAPAVPAAPEAVVSGEAAKPDTIVDVVARVRLGQAVPSAQSATVADLPGPVVGSVGPVTTRPAPNRRLERGDRRMDRLVGGGESRWPMIRR